MSMSIDLKHVEQLEDEITQLKRQLIMKENEFKKNEAVLQQKNELQQLQIEDFKRREQNFKKMNETIMNTLNDLSSNQKPNTSLLKEIQTTIQQHSIDLQSQKNKNGDQVLELERENNELREQIQELEERLRIKSDNQDEQIDSYMNQIIDLEKQIDSLKNQLKQQQSQFEQKSENKSKELEKDINQMKIRFQKEIEMEQNKHRQEKDSLEHRLEKNSQIIKKYQQIMEKQSQQQNQQDSNHNDIQLQQQIQQLHNDIHEKEQQYILEVNRIQKENDELNFKNQNLEQTIRNINEESQMNMSYLNITQQDQINNSNNNNNNYTINKTNTSQMINQTQNTQQSDHSSQKQSISELKKSIQQLEQQKLGKIRISQNHNPLSSSIYDINSNNDQSLLQKSMQQNQFLDMQQQTNPNAGKIKMSKSSKAQQIVSEIDRSLQQNISLLPEDLEGPDNISSIPYNNKDSSQLLFDEENSYYINDHTKENIIPQNINMTKKHNNPNNSSINQSKNTDQMPLALSEFEKRKQNSSLLQQNHQQNNKTLRSSQSSNNFLKNSHQVNQNNSNMHYNNKALNLSNNSYSNNKSLTHNYSCNKLSQPQQLQQNDNYINTTNHNQSNLIADQINNTIKNFQKNKQFSDELDISHTSSINLQNSGNNNNSNENRHFFKIFEQLNSEKQIIEQKLYQLENKLKYTEDHNDQLSGDRERLKQELNNVMSELNKAKMNSNIQDEEQEACTSALKSEIKFLINKLLKAKGKLNENTGNINTSSNQNLLQLSQMNNQHQNYNDSMVSQSANFIRNNTQQQNKNNFNNQSMNNNQMLREYSNFSIKSRDYFDQQQQQNYSQQQHQQQYY